MKGYSAFPKAPALLEPHYQIFSSKKPGHSLGWGSYPYAEIQSVYSTPPTDWAWEDFIIEKALGFTA